ncbi:tail protein X [Novosphingobium sp. Leaf2]|uniref:tail protein X n=1 Tax=Novosphingobium sp. Leaf2 TaxID=1735670 RepID=UPI0006FD6192|nr:tail protein X [Novosphingobium sp. Leaf2]KQM21952.1 phage tail protein [Novosphingobium sp. Leaf2]
MTIAIALAGDTVDAICWRELGRTRAVTEQVLALNPGLAALGPRLPAGTAVALPDMAQAAPPVLETVKLWD